MTGKQRLVNSKESIGHEIMKNGKAVYYRKEE